MMRRSRPTRPAPSGFRDAAVRGMRAVSSALATFSGWLAAYPSTNNSSVLFEFGKPRNGTGNQAIAPNLTTLTAQSRHVERSTCIGRAIAEGWKADFVGSGIDIQPRSGNEPLNRKLLDAWHDLFCEHACVDGMPLWEWQALMVGGIVTAGAGLSRICIIPERINRGLIPLALLPLEVEWIAERSLKTVPKENLFVRGIELDIYGCPVAYHLLNPERYDYTAVERVPVAEIVHIFEKRRAQQAHGEPVLAPAIERIMQDDRLVRSELQGSIAANAPALAITSENHGDIADADDTDTESDPVTDMSPGAVVRLFPGEDIKGLAPERPNEKLAPFRGTVRSDVAAATRLSQSHLSRDYSSSTFMNTRMEKMDTKRLQASMRSAVCRQLAGRIYELAFPWLMLSIGQKMPSDPIELSRLMRYDVRPDGLEYIDPTKDVAATTNAIANNLSTYQIECATRGKSFESVLRENAETKKQLEAAGFSWPTTTKPSAQPGPEVDGQIEEPSNA